MCVAVPGSVHAAHPHPHDAAPPTHPPTRPPSALPDVRVQALLPGLRSVGVLPELVLNAGSTDVKDYRLFFANASANIASMVKIGKQLGAAGEHAELRAPPQQYVWCAGRVASLLPLSPSLSPPDSRIPCPRRG